MSFDGAIVERWARAIFELGIETNQAAELSRQVTRFADTYAGSTELREVLHNPLVDEPKRTAIIADIAERLGSGPLAKNTVRLLAQRRRLRALPDIARRLAALADEKAGVLRAKVTSATRLDEAFYGRLTLEMETVTGRKIVLERLVDPSLIAGIVTKLGDNTIDGSLDGRLRELEKQLSADSG